MEINNKEYTKRQKIKNFVDYKIKGILQNENRRKAILSELRRGLGKSPSENPKLWGYYLDMIPDELLSGYSISASEKAIYTALTLFAYHQQGNDCVTSPMYVEGCTIGASVASLAASPDDRERITRKFNALAGSSSFEEAARHLFTLVSLLRSKGIPLDYGEIAGDFYRIQFSDGFDDVRMKWGKDYYKKLNSNIRKEQNND